MLLPFHPDKKVAHHCRSDLKPRFSRIRWCGFFAMASSAIILLRNDLPGRTTHVACWSCPINDCSSLFVQHRFPVHSLTSCSRRFNFSAWRCSDFDTVSISIPRKVILVAGPFVLWAAIGTQQPAAVQC